MPNPFSGPLPTQRGDPDPPTVRGCVRPPGDVTLTSPAGPTLASSQPLHNAALLSCGSGAVASQRSQLTPAGDTADSCWSRSGHRLTPDGDPADSCWSRSGPVLTPVVDSCRSRCAVLSRDGSDDRPRSDRSAIICGAGQMEGPGDRHRPHGRQSRRPVLVPALHIRINRIHAANK